MLVRLRACWSASVIPMYVIVFVNPYLAWVVLLLYRDCCTARAKHSQSHLSVRVDALRVSEAIHPMQWGFSRSCIWVFSSRGRLICVLQDTACNYRASTRPSSHHGSGCLVGGHSPDCPAWRLSPPPGDGRGSGLADLRSESGRANSFRHARRASAFAVAVPHYRSG